MRASFKPPEPPFPLPNALRRENRLVVRRCPAVPQRTVQPSSCCTFQASHESAPAAAGSLLSTGISCPMSTSSGFSIYSFRRTHLPTARRVPRRHRRRQPPDLVLGAVANFRDRPILSRRGRAEEALNQTSSRSHGSRSPSMCPRFLTRPGHVLPGKGEGGRHPLRFALNFR